MRFLLLLLAGSFAFAETPPLVEQALARLEAESTEEWAFTETTVENGTTFVRQHDPARPEGERWTLVSVDGREPTDAEREEKAGSRADQDGGENDEEDVEMLQQVDGRLRLAKDGPYVESLSMELRKPFSPGFGVKLKEFATVLTFEPVGPEQVALPRTVHVRIIGRAFLVKKIDETVEVTYTDYRKVE